MKRKTGKKQKKKKREKIYRKWKKEGKRPKWAGPNSRPGVRGNPRIHRPGRCIGSAEPRPGVRHMGSPCAVLVHLKYPSISMV
jgi:hypothetical protein